MRNKRYNGFKNSLCILLVLASSLLSFEFTLASTLLSEKCNVDPLPSWTSQEKWVWQKICSGDIADFNKAEGYGGRLDPFRDKNWPKNRILTQTFFETILLHKLYSQALPRQGINIVGVWFDKPIDLSGASLEHPLVLALSRFDKDVNLSYLKTSKLISFHGSKFRGSVNMERLKVESDCLMDNAEFDREVTLRGAKIDGQLIMGGGSKFKSTVNLDKLRVDSSLFLSRGAEFGREIILRSAKVGGQLVMGEGSKFNGRINMGGLEVDSGLYMDKAEFNGEVILIAAKVGPELDMSGSKFKNKVDINKLDVSGSLYMRDGANFEGEVILNSVQVGSQLSTFGSKFKDKLSIDGLKVDDLFMRNGVFLKDVDIIYTHVNRNLDISNSILNILDLTGTTIGGELRLGSKFDPPVKWVKGSKLILRNTNVVALQDIESAWPEELELDGFTYSSLGGLYGEETYSMATRKISWLKQWLEKQKYYSPQPYEQLSKVLIEAGQREKAKEVLYWSKNREKNITKGLDYLYLFFLQWTIGYSYKLSRIFLWVSGITAFGAILLFLFKQGPGKDNIGQRGIRNLSEGIVDNLFYSFDKLVPIIKLDKWSTVELTGLVRYYFYFHKIAGYLLSFAIIAWLTGIVYK